MIFDKNCAFPHEDLLVKVPQECIDTHIPGPSSSYIEFVPINYQRIPVAVQI